MKVVCILLLVVGLAAAKPYDFDELFKDDAASPEPATLEATDDYKIESPTHEYKTDEPATDRYETEPPTDRYKTDEPATDKPCPAYKTDDKNHGFWERFMHFLLVKSVEGVKPDEHPDFKYRKPGEELVAQLLNVKREVKNAFGPLMQIFTLMMKDFQEAAIRVQEAVANNDTAKAEHVVGEFFVAINRRMTMFVIEADCKGLFDGMDEGKKNVKRAIDEHGDKFDTFAKYILHNFNQFRVSDGLLDAPFVKLDAQTVRVFMRAIKQGEKSFKIGVHVYTDLISRMVSLSLDKHDQHGAIRTAGASVLSFIRRGTKAQIVLRRLYGPKKCYGPKGDDIDV